MSLIKHASNCGKYIKILRVQGIGFSLSMCLLRVNWMSQRDAMSRVKAADPSYTVCFFSGSAFLKKKTTPFYKEQGFRMGDFFGKCKYFLSLNAES